MAAQVRLHSWLLRFWRFLLDIYPDFTYTGEPDRPVDTVKHEKLENKKQFQQPNEENYKQTVSTCAPSCLWWWGNKEKLLSVPAS